LEYEYKYEEEDYHEIENSDYGEDVEDVWVVLKGMFWRQHRNLLPKSKNFVKWTLNEQKDFLVWLKTLI
jgi:hypothetical protein